MQLSVFIPEMDGLSKFHIEVVHAGIVTCKTYMEFLAYYRFMLSIVGVSEKYRRSQKTAARLWKHVKAGLKILHENCKSSFDLPAILIPPPASASLEVASESASLEVASESAGLAVPSDIPGLVFAEAASEETELVFHGLVFSQNLTPLPEPVTTGLITTTDTTVSTDVAAVPENVDISPPIAVHEIITNMKGPEFILEPGVVVVSDLADEIVSVNEKIVKPYSCFAFGCRRKRTV